MSKSIYIGSTKIAGIEGKSAYQSWLDAGNTGTESDFLAALKGDSGYSGAAGELEVVNDLTSGGSTAALSAEMGKTLNTNIGQLDEKVDENEDAVNTFISGTLNNFEKGYRLNDSSNHMGSSDSYVVSCYIPVSPGDSITWTYGPDMATTSVCGFYDANHEWATYYYSNVSNARTFTVPTSSSYTIAYLKATFVFDPTTQKVYENSSITRNGEVVWVPEYYSEPYNEAALSEQAIVDASEKEQARNNIGVSNALYGSHVNYIEGARLMYDGKINEVEGWRTTDFIPVTGGDVFQWNMGYGYIAASIGLVMYDSSHTYLSYWSGTTYIDTRGPLTLADDTTAAYIRVAFYKYRADGRLNTTPIVINGVPYTIADEVSGYTDYIKRGELEDELRWKPLQLGKLINSNTSQGELANPGTATRVTTAAKVTVPFEGVKIRFKSPNVPYRMAVYIWNGYANGTINTSAGTRMENNEVITLRGVAKAIRPVFMGTVKKDAWDVEISAQDVQNWIDSGELALEYYDESPDDVIARNKHLSTRVDALRRVLDVSNNKNNGMDKLPVFAHISDLHGDATRFFNFMEYCDKIGGIDFALNTGDANLYDHPDGTSYVDKIAGDHQTPLLYCIGNHESWPTGQSNLFNDNMATLVTQQGYLEAENTLTDHCYYYKDFAAKSVRVIALNYYEDGVYKGRIGQNQINWFISTLISTPAGYGIIVLLHSPEDTVVAEPPYDKFMQPSPKYGDSSTGTYVGDRPIMRIIDAFIEKTSLTSSYTDHTSTYNDSSDTSTETVYINADFTNVDPTTEFICYCVGHRHEDAVGYYEHSSQRQLCLCVVCGIALFGDSYNSAWTNQCDLPRGGKGTAQDAFNLYAIDRTGGNVRVVRVGADTTIRFAYRDMMELPYEKFYGTPINFTPGYRTSKNYTALEPHSKRAASDYIPVEEGDSIIYAYGPSNTSNVFCTFYDENKEFVTYYSAASNGGSRSFTVPESQNIKYLRATFYYDPERQKVLPPASITVNDEVVWVPRYAPYVSN